MGKILNVLAIMAIVTVQTFTIVHALEHGEDHHAHNGRCDHQITHISDLEQTPHHHHEPQEQPDHDGVPCHFVKIADRFDETLNKPADLCVLALPRQEIVVEHFYNATLLIPTVCQSSPGRAPPLA